MTNINIAKVANVVDNNCSVVVVSAIGKMYCNDDKITDMLLRLYYALPDTTHWEKIAHRYRQLVRQHCININIDRLLSDTLCKILHHHSYHFTLSVGEQLSAMIMARYLNRQYIEADQVIAFGPNGKLLYGKTINNIVNTVDIYDRYVVGGFYGGSVNGRMTFDRGGSDITGSLFARALGADIYENWTDVNGLCKADPILIDQVQSVRCLSYQDMQLLADYGVQVLNSHSIFPVRDAGIPVNIRNIYNIYDSGTIVTDYSHQGQVLCIMDSCSDGLYTTNIVITLPQQTIVNKVLMALAEANMPLLAINTNANCISVVTQERALEVIYHQVVD